MSKLVLVCTTVVWLSPLKLLLYVMQVVLFVNDTTVSKGMVKYASNLTRESIIDVEGTISVPQEPIAACSQSEVLAFCSSANLDLANFNMPLPAGLWMLPKKSILSVVVRCCCYTKGKCFFDMYLADWYLGSIALAVIVALVNFSLHKSGDMRRALRPPFPAVLLFKAPTRCTP